MVRGFVARLAMTAVAAMVVGTFGCKSTPEMEESAHTGSEFEEAPMSAKHSSPAPTPVRGSSGLATIYFDFDRYDIRSDARPALRGNADDIRDSRNGITIEGHCDERGSEEYNLALGERRANATKRYLVDLGVPATKLRTVSFGESRPAVQGHDETAWRYNRRAEFRSK